MHQLVTRVLPRHRAAQSAFTLVEVLVVIAIIGILAALGLAVAHKVASGGKYRATEGILKTLDQALSEHTAVKGGSFPFVYVDDANVSFPIIDARVNTPGTNVEPSLALFLAEATKTQSVKSIIAGIDPRYVEAVTPVCAGGRTPQSNRLPLVSQVVKDGFGNPIRFVSPAYHGGYGPSSKVAGRQTRIFNVAGADFQFTRSAEPPGGGVGDADEGMCLNNRPYFYSAGPDANPGTRDDNLYTTRPNFPAETTSRTNN